MHTGQLSISSSVRRPTTELLAKKTAEELLRKVLGPRYDLSVVFVGERRARALNRAYRGAEYVPNVLSFPLSPTAGEIYICPNVAVRQAPKYSLPTKKFILYLLIHGMLHLEGHSHGGKMNKAEEMLCKSFGIAYPQH